MTYQPDLAIAYAHKWAYGRNPAYYDFSHQGGDCTNFISQCLYAGCHVMNYTRDTGWYYSSPSNRAAAWSGVEYLYRFLLTNKGPGPYAVELPLDQAIPGDIIQLNLHGTYGHSLLVTGTDPELIISTHTDDSDNRPLSTYNYQTARLIHITGVRTP